jgi:(1->4)-alpha-D-glucan 1-alpha-D-glucosylmutase
VYLSPVQAARPGSRHGYDVTDPTRVNPELGGEEELRALAHDLHAVGMGIILDIVPNHMAATADNPFWDDVLQRGQASRYATWFDVEWDAPHAAGKVVLPELGDAIETVLAHDELRLHIRDSGVRVAYFDKTFPLDPATLPKELQLAQLDPAARPAADEWAAGSKGRERLRVLLDAQHYRLEHWRATETEGETGAGCNYRRFFDVNELVALRMDDEAVFDATHALILRLIRDGVLDGLRVDHVDGLRAPSWYLAKLRADVDAARHPDAPRRIPIFVEKILANDETLPSDWPVDGTTGYDFMNEVEELFLDLAGFAAIEANYRGLRHGPALTFQAAAHAGKRRTLRGPLRSDVQRVARLATRWRPKVSMDEMVAAIVELVTHLDVYRTYVGEPGVGSDADRAVLTDAFRGAADSADSNARALAVLQDAFFATPDAADTVRAELVARIQQLSGPAMAKGVEDTAHYVYVPLVSRNEVGGTPGRPLGDAHSRAHARNTARAGDFPRALLATNTHDTKRSADLRARLDALTAQPDVWARHVSRWRRLNKPRKRTVRGKPTPDTNLEYLFYQTLLGLWPAPRRERRADDLPDREWLRAASDRLAAYMVKAAREAKTRTSWTEADTQYEKAVEAFVRETLAPSDDAPFLPDVARLTALVAADGSCAALARVLIHCTAPGVPDFYQGDELWNFTLVDPDNRRPVDFERRIRLLDEIESPDFLRDAFGGDRAEVTDAVKLALIARLLRFRRDHPVLFGSGEYLPLFVGGEQIVSEHLFAFARRSRNDICLSIARTRPRSAAESSDIVALPNELEGQWHSVLTGRVTDLVRIGPQLTVPVDLLVPRGQPCDLLFRTGG